ncbi:MAG: hypothetical protein VYA30_13045 [Myxococcota bacterium]|nr:hypothetical protein [Myxococcota bacterium]
MSANGDKPDTPESQLEALVEAAGVAEVQRAKHRKLSVDKAIETLDELIKESRSELDTEARKRRRNNRSTRSAMDALFENPGEAPTGIIESTTVDSLESDETPEGPRLAGAQTAHKAVRPIRQLEDGIDFWDELETLDREETE